MAAVGAGYALADVDWGATLIFGTLSATLAFAALRNARALRGGR